MRWNHVQPRAWSRLACVGRPAIKIFFLELVHPFSRLPVNDTVPPRQQPVSAFGVISR